MLTPEGNRDRLKTLAPASLLLTLLQTGQLQASVAFFLKSVLRYRPLLAVGGPDTIAESQHEVGFSSSTRM